MSMDKSEPAFPVSSIDGFTQHGMTKREWFAGQALASAVSICHTDPTLTGLPKSEGFKRAAQLSYAFADAMLAEGKAEQ
jgi:hypothetical protein